MDSPAQFIPPRRTGFLFNAIIGAVLAGMGAFSIWYALARAPQADIAVWYLAGIVLLAPVLLFVYRAYALQQARYLLDRDGLRVRWGLRSEDISMVDIEWVRPARDLGYQLNLPLLRWPGSLYGRRETPELGSVEFLASGPRNLLLIATHRKVYAISPADTGRFLNAFRRANEMGSLTPLSSVTTLPTAFLRHVWSDIPARRLLMAGALSLAILIAASSLLVSAVPLMSMGYDNTGQPFEPGPSQYLLLLPILGSVVFVFDLAYGLFLYRRNESRIMSYFLWGSGIFTSLLLLTGILVAAL